MKHLCFLLLAVLLFPPSAAGQALDVEPEDIRPGLSADYGSDLDRDAKLTRIDGQPALAWGLSSPHPRLPAGPISVVWTGALLVKDAGVTFEAHVGGEVSVKVDGVTVLEGNGERLLAAREKFDRPGGLYRVQIRYRSVPNVPARLQLRWQGPTFASEPIPAWHFFHVPKELSKGAELELARGQGRAQAGRLGCGRCHQGALPGVTDPPPGPSLADVGLRVQRDWLVRWLDDPSAVLGHARMPKLFASDRGGLVERWLVAEYLVGLNKVVDAEAKGDHREGRKTFLSIGCIACHQVPDAEQPEKEDPLLAPRAPLRGLAERLPGETLAAFLGNPHGRYPDGRMPRLPLTPTQARDVAAYVLMWSGPAPQADATPSKEEIDKAVARLKVRDARAAGMALLQEKRCATCHPGLGMTLPSQVPLVKKDGCLGEKTLPRFNLDAATKLELRAYLDVAHRETHPSPVHERQRLLERSGCVRCHPRDSDRPPPLEKYSSTLGGAYLQMIPFQRTPRLSHAHEKYEQRHLLAAVREGVTGLRPARYTFRMPAFGAHAEALVQALAEADGELPRGNDPASKPADPTLATLTGPTLAGFQGYACVACHLWEGQALGSPDPGAIGPDLTRVAGRIRRDWFERFLENPGRVHPGTPMPTVFFRGKKASLTSILDGDAARQREALWHYFALGKDAPSPQPAPPLAVITPAAGEPPLVGLIPVHVGKSTVESLTLLYSSGDLLVYDLAGPRLHSVFVGGRILRHGQGRIRTYEATGRLIPASEPEPRWRLEQPGKVEAASDTSLQGYDLLHDGVRLHYRLHFPSAVADIVETIQLDPNRQLVRTLSKSDKRVKSDVPEVARYPLPAAEKPPVIVRTALADPGKKEGSLERPGYRALAYPRPKTAWGEDLLMPSALAVHPRDGRVFVASMKLGEIFVLRDPSGDGTGAHFDNYGRGLFQETYGMLAEEKGLYVLHRRNLTRLEEDSSGRVIRAERVAQLTHGIGESYDYGYGLVRDPSGAFVWSYAPHANRKLAGSGGALRFVPGQPPQEVAYGFRNPIGWCTGPDGDVFFTDNQGEWVATNKLCHLQPGRFFGYPNPEQKQHASKPPAPTALWVPYEWARSINGVTYDSTGGKFGPFAGQFFLAELMFGGGIVRASLEKVNGVYQGACFPFWGKGLMGPLTLAFDPRGRLFVGSVTEPGWMAQPDRGALYRLDFTGQVPFEMQSIQVLPQGFRIVFTREIDAVQAAESAAYHMEHYRYEYTGAYGSPELERTRVTIAKAAVAKDRRSVELTTGPLQTGRVYRITASVRSAAGEALVHPTGAYTLNEIPRDK